MQGEAGDAELLTTREVAALLRIKERKVYDLVAAGEIPHVRVTGKLLFPRALLDAWLLRHSEAHAVPRVWPDIVAGSHDPLLDWALRESGAGLATFFDGSLDGLLGMGIDRAGCLVHHEDLRIGDDRAGEGNQLFLAGRELVSALADLGVVPFFQPADEVVGIRDPGRSFNVFRRRLVDAVHDVFQHGAVKQKRVLEHHADVAPQIPQTEIPQVDSV